MLEELVGAIARVCVGVLVVAVGLELGLRLTGLATVIRYIPDAAMGHRLAPGQQLRRWNRRFLVNRYSMRNGDITPSRPRDTLRILVLGDSVANGGLAIAQHHTIPALLEQRFMQLAQEHRALSTHRGDRVQVLNASASAWGPRNELGYLQTFGTFNAQIIVLLLNTDDLFAGPPSATTVNSAANAPGRIQGWAIAQLVKRHRPIGTVSVAEPNSVAMNLEAIRAIHQIACSHHAQLMVAMTPLQREIAHVDQRHYERESKRKLHRFLIQLKVPFLDCGPAFHQALATTKVYRDSIHLTVQGNRLVASLLAQLIQQQLMQQPR